MRGTGRSFFAALMLMLLGTLNIVYGLGALGDASVLVGDTRFILDDLNTMGWVLMVLGVVQITGGMSLFSGRTYGRVIGVAGGLLGAVGAMLSIGGAFPWWSLAMFVLCIYVVQGILVLDKDARPSF